MKEVIKYLVLLFSSIALFSCTIGVISSDATVSGRPIVFKTRDIRRTDVQFNTFTPSDGYAYSANTYIDDNTVWFGVNEAGFGITQSDITNYAGHSGTDNGNIMTYALRNFATVDEFDEYLDSTNYSTRRVVGNYAVIDAEGDAAIFEVNNFEYYRYEPNARGFLVRANYGFEGDSTNTYGIDRMNKADSLIQLALDGDSLDAAYISMRVMADFSTPYQNPYPLPFFGSYPGMEVGWVDTDYDSSDARAIYSNRTVCSGVIESAAPFEDPSTAVMYAGMDTPAISVPFVMFPAAHTPPPYVSGSSPAYLNLARDSHNEVFHEPLNPDYIDTYVLKDSSEGGLWSFVHPATEWVFNATDSFINYITTTAPSEMELIAYQDSIMELAYSVMASGDFSLAIEEDVCYLPSIDRLSVYPNPFHDFIAIMQPEDSEVQIFDISGKVIESGIFKRKNCGIIWRPTNDISDGVYIAVSVREDGKNQAVRFVYVQK